MYPKLIEGCLVRKLSFNEDLDSQLKNWGTERGLSIQEFDFLDVSSIKIFHFAFFDIIQKLLMEFKEVTFYSSLARKNMLTSNSTSVVF